MKIEFSQPEISYYITPKIQMEDNKYKSYSFTENFYVLFLVPTLSASLGSQLIPLHWIFLLCTLSFFGNSKFLRERLHSHLFILEKFDKILTLPLFLLFTLSFYFPRLVSLLKYLLTSSLPSSQSKATPFSSCNYW